MSGENRPRTVKLYCPSVSKLVQLAAWEEQRLDLGSIARAFGLDPSTLKLNEHFISRGVDFVSSSVTWRSLLSFFSAKGLSTGKDDTDALIVDGKLSKVGSKRAHDPEDAVNLIYHKSEPADDGCNGRSLPADINLLKNKRLRDTSSGCREGGLLLSKLNGLSFKRKQFWEDGSFLKKLKINETSSDHAADFPGKGDNHTSTAARTPLKCSFVNGNMKRMREGEVIAAASQKRIR